MTILLFLMVNLHTNRHTTVVQHNLIGFADIELQMIVVDQLYVSPLYSLVKKSSLLAKGSMFLTGNDSLESNMLIKKKHLRPFIKFL